MARSASRAPANPLLYVLMESVASVVKEEERDFSARQLVVFLKAYLEPNMEHTVRGLAADLNVSKPAITRALDRLEELEFARREKDPQDGRSIIVRTTPTGAAYLRKLTAYVTNASKKAAKATRKAA